MACLYFRIHLIQGKLYLQAHKLLNTIKSRPNGYVQTCDTCKTVTEKQVQQSTLRKCFDLLQENLKCIHMDTRMHSVFF